MTGESALASVSSLVLLLPSCLPVPRRFGCGEGSWLSFRAFQPERNWRVNEVIIQGSSPCPSGHTRKGPAPPAPCRIYTRREQGWRRAPDPSELIHLWPGSQSNPEPLRKRLGTVCQARSPVFPVPPDLAGLALEHDSGFCRPCPSRSPAADCSGSWILPCSLAQRPRCRQSQIYFSRFPWSLGCLGPGLVLVLGKTCCLCSLRVLTWPRPFL